MKILRATHMGMCFGVRDAIQLAKEVANEAPVTILGELVHNETVLDDLRERGIQMAARIEPANTKIVIVTAHGASETALNRVRAAGHNVMEATCPLVRVAHDAVKKLEAEGYHPLIIGRRNHVEVRGLTGDLKAFDVIACEEDLDGLAEHRRIGVVAQTTQPIEKVRQLVQCIRARFPNSEVRFSDTVCQPTKQRQTAAVALARQCDVVVVIGGRESNNTRELARTCGHFCPRVHHVQTAADLDSAWFDADDTVGITAGTSTPDEAIVEVESRLRTLTGVPCSAGACRPAE
jgi:4-hydroxy-3-methylbut-2-enyl diphosphate reductase